MQESNALADAAPYLLPYLRAVRAHGAGFGSLLWASPATQAVRFAAIRRICDLSGRFVIDAGCGRGDLLADLRRSGMVPSRYLGLEAMDELATAAGAMNDPLATIERCDFLHDPSRLEVGADVIIFCGSLNTFDLFAFDLVLRHAWRFAGQSLVFNFLSSPLLAAAPHLTWHEPRRVLRLARSLSRNVRMLDDYFPGDCTIRISRGGT